MHTHLNTPPDKSNGVGRSTWVLTVHVRQLCVYGVLQPSR
jgi:hypothetical protein